MKIIRQWLEVKLRTLEVGKLKVDSRKQNSELRNRMSEIRSRINCCSINLRAGNKMNNIFSIAPLNIQ